MKWSKLSPLALFVIANTSMAAFNFSPSENTQLKVGGYINAGYHGQTGDYADWDNISAQQESARNVESTLNSPTASEKDKKDAQNTHDILVASRPYWEEQDTSLSDTYIRLNMELTHRVNDDYGFFAFYERDLRTGSVSNDDLTRDAFVGISSKFGNLRFGRDESALTHVRDLIYPMEEKDGYSYHSFIEPLSVTGRHDNTFIYSYSKDNFGIELGYVFETEENYISQNAYSASAKYILIDSLTFALGYSGGKITTDKEGYISRPNMTGHGYSSYNIDRLFAASVYNPAYELEQKQFNFGFGYKSGALSLGTTFFVADYLMDIHGQDNLHNTVSNDLDYTLKGGQASIAYKVMDNLELAAVYSRSVNSDEDFKILNAVTVGAEYMFNTDVMLYSNVGKDHSDESHNAFVNTGLRYNF